MALAHLTRFLESRVFDLIVVSGDWTQRARSSQFQEAERFVKSLQAPVISVPGNHDIPLYHLWRRIFNPYRNYDRYLKPWICGEFQDDLISVCGFSTVNRFSVMEGRLSRKDIAHIRSVFSKSQNQLKLLVCHHPVAGLESELSQEGIEPDLILTGHTHLPMIKEFQLTSGKKGAWVSCGTTISSRHRSGHLNSLNIIEISEKNYKVETFTLKDSGFEVHRLI